MTLSLEDIHDMGFDWPGDAVVEAHSVVEGGRVDLPASIERLRTSRAAYKKQIGDAYTFKMQSGADYADFTDRFDDLVRTEDRLGQAISFLERIVEAARSRITTADPAPPATPADGAPAGEAFAEGRDAFDLASLQAAVRQGVHPDYLFFWGHQAHEDDRIGRQCLSQWWSSPFDVGGVAYPTAEHYMMAEKARLFRDGAARRAILNASHPRQAKQLGRSVRRFDQATWETRRFEIVVRGNLLKFSQNDDLRAYLLGTGNQVLVEASPTDRVWGIGMGHNDPRATNPEEWEGLNLLGFALIKVRWLLRQE